MPPYISFNFTYDSSNFLNLFNESKKTILTKFDRKKADLEEGICESPLLEDLFLKFPYVTKHDLSIEIFQFIGNSRPHINTGNNGLLVFPLWGSWTLNTYSYETSLVDDDGRPVMHQMDMPDEEIAEIELTKTDTIVVKSPIAIDGLRTFSLHNDGSNAVVLVLKISKDTNWETVYNSLKNTDDD